MEHIWDEAPWPRLVVEEEGYHWTAPVVVPWYRTAAPPRLSVAPSGEPGTPPTPAQAAAYLRIQEPHAALMEAILATFRQYVPELATASWPELEAFFELNDVRIFPSERDGLAYVGLVFCCLQWDFGYEHGAGTVVHGDRLVTFGMAEEAEHENAALIDLGLLEPDEDEEDES